LVVKTLVENILMGKKVGGEKVSWKIFCEKSWLRKVNREKRWGKSLWAINMVGKKIIGFELVGNKVGR
jgi:hypothetical protein